MEQWQLPDGWEWKTLPEICEVNPPRPRIQRSDDAPTSFVPMQSVNDVEGKIVDMQTRSYGEIKRGYTYFEENDVLLAKITPSMENGKAAVARGLIDGFGFGTTEFHVFHPHEGISPDWIFYYIRRQSFRMEAKSRFRGAVGQQRVPEDFLISYAIPIPYPDEPARSFEIQRHIMTRLEALLAEVAEVRGLQEKIVEDTRQVMDAILSEVFPNPENDLPVGWQLKTIEAISENPQYGYTQSAKKEPVGPKFLRITDIQDGLVEWSQVPFCKCDQRTLDRYRLQDSDIVFARTGATTGKTFLIKNPPESVFASYLIRLRILHNATPDFVYWFFQSPYYWRQIIPRGGAQPNMNAQLLKQVRVPIPTSENMQKQIIAHITAFQDELREMQKGHQENTKLITQLEQSFLAQAFRGEL
jgi:type I restriction enzyme, S subunit